jgi:putative endonuclease
MMQYFVYILKSLNHPKTYVGIAEDVDTRLKEHNAKRTKSTKAYTPYLILHQEEFECRPEARKREKYLKSGAGREWIKKTFFVQTD